MANAVWPVDLPQKFLLSASERLPNNVISSQTDAGIPKIRRRFTSALKPYRGSVIMTREQCDLLEEFFRGTLKDGSLSFEWTHPRQGVKTFRFTAGEPPEIVYSWPQKVSVSISLEILP